MTSLRVLAVEDNPDDVELVLHELREGGYTCEWKRVDRPESFRAALEDEAWDVVLSDFNMPRFTGRAALEILKATGKDIPFIIVSGSVGEAVAVEAMRAGAHDFFPKANLTRLAAAVERELREVTVRRERRQAVAQLRRAEERHRLIVDNVRDYAIFMLDEDGRVASWNQGAERLTGYDEAAVLGEPLALFFPDDDGRGGTPEEALRTAKEAGSYRGEGARLRRDGTRFWASLTLDAIHAEGALRGYSAVLRDVTERQRLVEDLRQAVRARDEFLSIASHELKTPLTSMGLQLESMRLLAQQADELRVADPRVEKKLAVVERQADRLLVLVQSLLDVTRITSGGVELCADRLDLLALVESVVAHHAAAIEASGCEVSVGGVSGVGGEWDRVRLETAIGNLLGNALKYGAGKPVAIEVDAGDGSASVRVTDQGFGIAGAEQARIFERFERAVPEQNYGGLGLGLWIVRTVVEAHGGAVRVDSALGAGSTFTIHLPLDPTGRASDADRRRGRGVDDGHGTGTP